MRTIAVLSMLADPPGRDGAAAARTLARLADVGLAATVVLHWDDQPVLGGEPCGSRRRSPHQQALDASLRWTDGWRGGPLGATEFDRGHDAAILARVAREHDADAVLLVSPAAGRLDPDIVRDLLALAERRPDEPFVFAPATPGLAVAVCRRAYVDELAARPPNRQHPGTAVAYDPDRPRHDPLARDAALPLPPAVTRTLERLTLDDRSIDAPRELTLELTTRRNTRPTFDATDAVRPDLPLETARAILDQFKHTNVRLTLAGVGDPLLHPQFAEVVAHARAVGIAAIHVETDLLPDDPAAIDRLVELGVDIVSIHIPAARRETYAAVMGVDRMPDVLDNLKRLVIAKQRRNSGLPILVPTFVKLRRNLGEMEAWFDGWHRAVGTAVITAPRDFVDGFDMTPPTRGPCRRLSTRLAVLCDGRATCDEDVEGRQAVGPMTDGIEPIWGAAIGRVRDAHRRGDLSTLPVCQTCRMWDRP